MRAVALCVCFCLAAASNPALKCPSLTPRTAPDDVKQLKPVDVKVVAAMGDSITAGFALTGKPVESRDLSYATGNATGATTMATIHARFRGKDAVNGINVAQTNDKVQGIGAQAAALVAQIKGDKRINFQKDWKLVTVLIGANNDCPACQGKAEDSPSEYEKELGNAVYTLNNELPRTLVSLVSMLNVTSLLTAPGVDRHCGLQHVLTKIECPCIFEGAQASAAVDANVQADNAKLLEIAKYWDGYDKSFGVVVQPGLSQMDVPDWTFLSQFDCFHPSLEAHQNIGIALWNNMLQPVGKKQSAFKMPVQIRCPTDDDFLHN